MESPSFVTKARTAFHSAAARAERVLTDFKSDRSDADNKQSPREHRNGQPYNNQSPKSDSESKSNNEGKHMRWKPAPIGIKQDWQDRFKNIRVGKKGGDSPTEKVDDPTMALAFYDENLYMLNMKNDAEIKASQVPYIVERLNATSPDNIPPASVIKQLAVALDAGKKYKSIKDFVASSGSSSPIRERASLSLAAMKSLVLRDKDDKIISEFENHEKVMFIMQSLYSPEGDFLRRKVGCSTESLSFIKDIHGAPPDSFLVKLSEVIGSFKTLRNMAILWCKTVAELRRLWSEELHVPGIPLDESLDLHSCLLYQQFQVINCCVSRKKRNALASESLEAVLRDAGTFEESAAGSNAPGHLLYAKTSSGELVLRLGAGSKAPNLFMLETGEPIYAPIPQEGPLLTEDVIKETEEFVLRTGSVGAGCSQLLSDMQGFKVGPVNMAANPGCILEDFVRWHSPPDWTNSDPTNESNDVSTSDGDNSSSTRGYLSSRMQKEGNLWRELWETSKPVPAVKQAPLFDEDLAVEGILNHLENIHPCELFEQLFISLLGLGTLMAEAKLSSNDDLSKLFYECKEYIVVTCQGKSWIEKVDDLCQVYETMEAMLLNPDEVVKMMKQADDANTPGTVNKRSSFLKLGLNFGIKDRNPKRPSPRCESSSEESPGRQQPFSNFFEGKSSLFSKNKPPKPGGAASPGDKTPSAEENDWTLV
ncbi:Rab3 GTPase-activating protein catalytic subunit [Linum perenne]